MDKFEYSTDSLCHQFPSSKTRGLRSSQYILTEQQQSFSPSQICQFPTLKHRPKIPHMTFKPKTQFPRTNHPYHVYREYQSLSRGQNIEASSLLKQQTTAINSILSSGIKHSGKQKERECRGNPNNREGGEKKQLSYCISPIKIDEGSVMTPVDKQMVNVLMKLVDRMDRIENREKKKEKEKSREDEGKYDNGRRREKVKREKKSRSKEESRNNSESRSNVSSQVQQVVVNLNNSKHNLKESKYQFHSRSLLNAPMASESKPPQIVINNIIKGKPELSENKRSRIYDIMDYELRKQENLIRKLENQRDQSKNRKMRYRTPDITQFEMGEIQKEKLRQLVKEDQASKAINPTREHKQSLREKAVDRYQAQSEYSRTDLDNQEIFCSNLNKKPSINPSVSSGNTQYIQSNESSTQQNTQKDNPEVIRTRTNMHKQQTHTPKPLNPGAITHLIEYRTQPMEIEHKKAIVLQFPVNSNSSNKQNISLAQAFQKRRHQFNSQRSKEQRRQKSKEQLAQIRKNMMKKRPTRSSKPESIQATIIDSANTSMKLSKREPSKELLDRLISGTKGPIDRKEMRALTQKNYQQLPEVRQKREDMRKKEEMERRMMQKRQYDKSIRKHR